MTETLDHALKIVGEEDSGVMIEAFTQKDVDAIASLPLSLLKSVLNEAQFNALTKFVNINQTIMGLDDKVTHNA